jgi:hypothetical protein
MAPSPLIRLGQAKTSAEAPNRVTPVPEHYAGTVFPYRGTETHGVDPSTEVTIDPEEADYGTTVAVPLEPVEKEQEPVPVKIVGEGGPGELRTWFIIREYVRTGEGPRRIVGQDENRTKVKIRNLHAADTLWIMAEPYNDTNFGYPILAGAELELTAVTDVWAKVGAAADISVACLIETSIKR